MSLLFLFQLNPHPLPQQIWNGDEKGFTTNARHPPSFSYRKGNHRNFTIIPGERSLFWSTLFYWIRADGFILDDVTVVHEGGTEVDMPSKFISGIPDNWRVHSTSSGYMDKSGFLLCIDALVQHIRKRDGSK